MDKHLSILKIYGVFQNLNQYQIDFKMPQCEF